MNVAANLTAGSRRADSPYARRLAREMGIALQDLAGTGPRGRITAADIRAYEPVVAAKPVDNPVPVAAPVQEPVPAPASATFTFSATVSLADFYRLSGEVARVGRTLDIEDAALRAARTSLIATGRAGGAGVAGIALEADGRQILVSTGAGLSIGTERSQRLAAIEAGADVSSSSAILSLLVLRAARAIPVSMPLLPGRSLRLVLVVDAAGESANALLCARAGEITEVHALEMLEAFVVAMEQPLALMA